MPRDGVAQWEQTGTKVCNGCGIEKNVEDFAWRPDKRLKRGGTYAANCRDCGKRPYGVEKGVAAVDFDFGYHHAPKSLEAGAMGNHYDAIVRGRMEMEEEMHEIEAWANAGFAADYEVIG